MCPDFYWIFDMKYCKENSSRRQKKNIKKDVDIFLKNLRLLCICNSAVIVYFKVKTYNSIMDIFMKGVKEL